MARGTLVPIEIVHAGADPTPQTVGDASNGHQVPNGPALCVIAKNTNGGSTARTITFETPNTEDGNAVADYVVSIPAGGLRLFPPFDPNVYGSTLLIDVSNAELVLDAVHIA